LNKIYRYIRSNTTPSNSTNDLIFAEFPKSGVTWISLLVANSLASLEDCSIEFQYSSYNFAISDLSMGGSKARFYANSGLYLYKSHSLFNPYYRNVIYLVRNPIDTMTSYYKYLTELGVYHGSFGEFIKDKKYGLPSWKRHVLSWLNNQHMIQRLYLFKYEDFVSSPEFELQRLFKLIGVNIPVSAIEKSVVVNSVDTMRANEALYRSVDPRHPHEFIKGKKTQPKKEDIDFILTNSKEERKLIGYE